MRDRNPVAFYQRCSEYRLTLAEMALEAGAQRRMRIHSPPIPFFVFYSLPIHPSLTSSSYHSVRDLALSIVCTPPFLKISTIAHIAARSVNARHALVFLPLSQAVLIEKVILNKEFKID